MKAALGWPRQLPRQEPRLLFHSGHARQLARAADFYRPVTARARTARRALVVALRVGGPPILRMVGACVPDDTAALIEIGVSQLREVVDEPLGGVVGGHGAPGPDRKITLVALSYSATPLAFAKVSAGPAAASAVRGEASALEAVTQVSLGVSVPRLLRWRTVGVHEVIVTAPLKGVAPRSDSALDAGRLAFLRQLARVRRKGAIAAVEGIGDVLSHGDFTPWNCLYGDGKLVGVLDWECLSWRAPGYDVVHHEVQRRVHFSALPVEAEVRSVLLQTPRLLAEVAPGHDPWNCLLQYCVETLKTAGVERWSERGIKLRRELLLAIAGSRAG